MLHFGTVKPLDTQTLLAAVRRAGKVVTVEEHQIAGGFGSAVTEALSELLPVPVHRLGLIDSFGQSGEPEELLRHYGLDAAGIRHAVEKFL